VTATSEPGKGIGVYGAPARKHRQLTKDFKVLVRPVLLCCTALRRDWHVASFLCGANAWTLLEVKRTCRKYRERADLTKMTRTRHRPD